MAAILSRPQCVDNVFSNVVPGIKYVAITMSLVYGIACFHDLCMHHHRGTPILRLLCWLKAKVLSLLSIGFPCKRALYEAIKIFNWAVMVATVFTDGTGNGKREHPGTTMITNWHHDNFWFLLSKNLIVNFTERILNIVIDFWKYHFEFSQWYLSDKK